MATWQVEHAFEFQRHGWKEVYYITADTAADAASFTASSVRAFLDMRTPGVLFKAIKVTDVYNPRVGLLRPIGVRRNDYSGNLGSTEGRLPDVAQTAVYCRLSAASGPSRPVFYRGLQDINVRRNADGTPYFPSILPSLQEMKRVITQAPAYQIRSTRPGSNVTASPKKILSVQHIGDGETRVFLKAADYAALHGNMNQVFDGGTVAKVLIQGGSVDSHNLPGLKGIFRVLRWGEVANSLDIAYNIPLGVLEPVTPQKLTVRNLWYQFNDITDLTPTDFRSRDTGRPTSLQRGRSRRVQSRL